jgi:hypothetical protein
VGYGMQQTSSPPELEATPVPIASSTGTSPTTTTPYETKAQEPASLIWAYRLFWITFLIFFAATGGGKVWDRVYHLTVRFDTFWSPPHFFIFVMTSTSGLLVAAIAAIPKLRVWFGPSVRAPIFRWEMAGTLVFLGAGLIAISLDLMLDNLWHTAFGLDETQWSFPHDALAWCWFTIPIGFMSARLAFQKYRPIGWFTKLAMGFLILVFLCPPILEPLYINYSPMLLTALKNVPIVRGEPTAQHMYRIYLAAGITRQTSALFIPEVTVFAGIALAMLRKLDARISIFLLAPLAWSCAIMGRDLYTILFVHVDGVKTIPQALHLALQEPSLWVPIPLLLAAICYTLLQQINIAEKPAYMATGMIFAICTFFIWHNSNLMLLLVIPAPFLMVFGAWVGRCFYSLMEHPTSQKVVLYIIITSGTIPAFWGAIDLTLRHSIP